MVVHVVPLKYCQVPCAAVAVLPMMATPYRVLADEPPLAVWLSAASEKLALNSVLTVAPGGLVASSRTAARLAEPLATGASLTALTKRLAVSVADEKAVVPPLTEVSAVPPLLGVVWSQARKVMALAT